MYTTEVKLRTNEKNLLTVTSPLTIIKAKVTSKTWFCPELRQNVQSVF